MDKLLKLKFLILIGFISSCIEIYAQNREHDIKIDTTYFLLGTLSDYMGRFQYVNRDSQIDRYYPYEKPLMVYVDSLIIQKFKVKITVDKNLNTFSKDAAATLNSFYDENWLFIDTLFNNSEEIHSFLTGKYYRYGEKLNDTIFKIQLANSPSHKICNILLNKIKCSNINFKYLANTPAQFIYYFRATDDLKLYFSAINKQKEMLDNSFYESIKLIIGKEEVKKMQIDREKENLEIIKTLK